MGLVNFGVPEKEVEFLKENMKLDILVEGGTYKGGTAKSMSKKFRKVYTIEKSDVMFDFAKENLKGTKNVTLLKGDTREHLHSIMENNDNILFWLDAHWSGGDTYGEEDQCPLLDELKIIFEYKKNNVLLIDDARLFLAPPPEPHKIPYWPTLLDIINVLPARWEVFEYEDVLYIIPERMKNDFSEFLQKNVTYKWKQYKSNSLIKRIVKKFGLC